MSDTRNGKWIDEWGACRVCDGEIPHGHTPNCDYWKLEQERDAAVAKLAKINAVAGKILEIGWGYDGDCGATKYAHEILDLSEP